MTVLGAKSFFLYGSSSFFSDRNLEDSCGSSVNSMSEYITSQGSCPDTVQGKLLFDYNRSVSYKIPH